MIRPLLFVWPYWLIFWPVMVWAYLPEFKIVNRGQKAVKRADSPDAGSLQVIMVGGGVGSLVAFLLAGFPTLLFPTAWQPIVFALGVATLIGASLLRRHCFRMLGASFTGDVRAQSGQSIVQTGAYAFVRHPSYSAGILFNVALGLALGSWASLLLLTVVGFVVYAYRIAVEERTLVAVLGEPYREFMRTRKRLIPYIY